ncbi:sporulation protein [Bacillus sp. RG28]|uniref:Sporulation protein n=1 Tax=Gottfriedia endophytica TaxID=2820819 RepID=A0A940NH35_9BACI|nr:sporulation protein [Gottfriedia endophytica]MBP0723897.1 sporulation protein [Gottfriedia endophytica]
MNIFKRTISDVRGKSGLKIDAVLEKSEYVAGELVRGHLYIKGGKVKQAIDSVYIQVMTDYSIEFDDMIKKESGALQSMIVSVDSFIQPDEELMTPFFFTLSENTPISLHQSHVWISARLANDKTDNQYDADAVQIVPSAGLKTIIQAIQEEGFILRNCENKKNYGKITQELEFFPLKGQYQSSVNDIKITYLNFKTTADLTLQVNPSSPQMFNKRLKKLDDEFTTRISFSINQINDKDYIRSILTQAINRKLL